MASNTSKRSSDDSNAPSPKRPRSSDSPIDNTDMLTPVLAQPATMSNTHMRIPRLPYLPAEIRDAIESFREDEVIDLISLPIRPKVLPRSKNPSFPPADGSCPLMKLPTEILRQILHEVVILPTKDRVIDPRPPKKEEKTIRNLLVLNKRIYDVLTMILYEERTFGIYVHEGLNGGIEFLDSGIQPLQHKDAFTYLSFPRFDEDSNTGVARVRKVIVTIYPAYDSALLSGISVGHTLNDRRQGEEARHLPLLTYFMLTALSDLLSRHSELGKTRRLTSLTVQFAPPHIEPTAEQNQLTGKWEVTKEAKKRATDAANSILLSHFCADGRTAKATSISGISNMEIILSGFEKLWGVHNARVYLPPGHRDIKALAGLGADVRAAVMRPSADGGKTLAKNLVAARVALEEWVNFAKNGFRFNFEDQMLTEDDWMDGHEQEFDEFGIESDGEDDDFD